MPRAPKKKSQARKRRAPVRSPAGQALVTKMKSRPDFSLICWHPAIASAASSVGLSVSTGKLVTRDGSRTTSRSPANPHPANTDLSEYQSRTDQQVTTNGFPGDFVDLAWGMWLGRGTSRTFRRGADAIVLAAAGIPTTGCGFSD